MPGSAAMFAFARNVREVSTVVMPQRSMAAVIASRPAVKFRLTGMRPAIEVPMLASAPPTDAGSRRPIDCPAAAWRRIARARSRLPTSARPKVSSRPVESAIPSEDHRRLAVRRNRMANVSRNSELITETENEFQPDPDRLGGRSVHRDRQAVARSGREQPKVPGVPFDSRRRLNRDAVGPYREREPIQRDGDPGAQPLDQRLFQRPQV